jgi:hypothetical protein
MMLRDVAEGAPIRDETFYGVRRLPLWPNPFPFIFLGLIVFGEVVFYLGFRVLEPPAGRPSNDFLLVSMLALALVGFGMALWMGALAFPRRVRILPYELVVDYRFRTISIPYSTIKGPPTKLGPLADISYRRNDGRRDSVTLPTKIAAEVETVRALEMGTRAS